MWLGGLQNDLFLSDAEKQQFPDITSLGKEFDDFQNSPYRGEFNQIKSLTFGRIQDILAEVARLIKINRSH